MNIHELLDQKFTSGNDVPVSSVRITREEYEAAVKHAVGGDEPFGYFRTEAFGWTDCKQDDVGAKPLYERPQTSQLNLDYLREMGRLEARIRELEQASAAVPEDVWKSLLEAVMREMPKQEYRGNAPGHAHAVPGVWDADNVPELAGKPCAWCLAYSTARQLLAASQPEVKNV